MRAPRYPLNLPLQYRFAGQPEWIAGTSVNISSTGVLFRALASHHRDREQALAMEILIEMKILLEDSSVDVAELEGEGRVVRLESPDPSTLAVAAAFSACELRPLKHQH